MVANFPTVDRNHQISKGSKELLHVLLPAQWEATEQAGGSDYGFDYSIQVAPEGQVTHTFRAQLKGVESPRISANGKTLSIPLKRTTLNMYATTQEEVMLLVAVIHLHDSSKVDLKNSRIYWQWLAPELERLRGSRYAIDESSQESIVVHIPLSQELSPALNVTPHLNRRLEEARATETLETIALQAGVIPVGVEDPMQQLIKAVEAQPSRFFQNIEDDEIESGQSSSLASEIAQTLSYVKVGQTDLAEEAVSQLNRLEIGRKPALKAALLSVEGKIAVQRRRRVEALELFDRAYDSNPIERHLLAREELRFLEAIDLGDQTGIALVAKSLADVCSDEGLSLLARVQVAMRDFTKAYKTVTRISESARTMPYLVVLSGEHRWAEVRTKASHALTATNLTRQSSMGLHLVAARACWSQAMSTAQLSSDEMEMPLTGSPGIDLEAAKTAWQFSKACLLDLKKLGWQPNVELLAPVAMASAAVIGKHDEAIPLMKEAALARPEYLELQENLELLAISVGSTEVAIEANLRQPESHAVLVRRACLQFQTQQFASCLETALNCLADLDRAVKQTPMALAMGSAAAVKLARTADAERLMTGIQSNESWGEFEYFARFVQESMMRKEDTPSLDELREGLKKFPSSFLLLAHLFSNLSTDENITASEVVALARRLRIHAALSDRDWHHLIHALFKLELWQDGERETRGAIERFGETDRTLSLLAVAVEMQGRTGDAIALLKRALTMGKSHAATLRNYLGLCLRLGHTKESQQTIEKLLGLETVKAERLDLLRLNGLLLMQLGLTNDAYGVVKTIGELVDHEVELEEGMYLNLFMGVTINMPSLNEHEAVIFRGRVAKFSLKWPESRLFRSMNMSEDGVMSLDKLNAMLGETLGVDLQKRMLEFRQRESQARDGLLPVPYVARPSFVFHYIDDVFTLWEYAKKSKQEDRQYHLTCAFAEYAPTNEQVLRDIPLLDLTALLILHDLDLFSVLFSLFPRIAVSRITVDYISQNARAVFGNGVATKYAESLLRVINENLERIDQPATERNAVQKVTPLVLLNDYVTLAKSSRWVVYSDDAITRMWISHDNQGTKELNTLDLLRLADEKKLLSAVEVGNHLVKLAAWNVEIIVTSRYFLATLNGALDGTTGLSVDERLDRFHAHEPFAKLARALWRTDKSAADLVLHISGLVAELLKESSTEEDSVAAIWAFWFNRLRLVPNLNQHGWDLLNYSVVMALYVSAPGSEQRLVNNMLKVAEVINGPNKISIRDEDEVVTRLGSMVGGFSKRNSTNGEGIRAKIAKALPSGTHRGDVFEAAYFAAVKQ